MELHFIVKNQQFVHQRTKKVQEVKENQWGGTTKTWHSEPDGKELVTYDVTVDYDVLRQMARRAARSKGGKCVDGPLKVSIRERREISKGGEQ